MIALAAALAGASALSFAASTSLQHQAASRIAITESHLGLVLQLARQPRWILGVSASAVGSVAHAVAVHVGALVIVQPIVVSGIVFAVPVRAALDRRRASRRDLYWVSVAAAGLALFIVVANPSEGVGKSSPMPAAWLIGAGVALMAVTMSSSRRMGRATQKGLLLSVAAGLAFGLAAGLLKMVTESATESLLGAAGYWPTWVMLALSGTGFALNQRCYQLAPLSMTMPLLNVVNVLVAVVFGWYVFDERPAHDPMSLLLEVAALALMFAGVRRLANHEQPARNARSARVRSGSRA